MVAFAQDSIMSARDVESATTVARIETARRVRLGHFVAFERDDHIQDLLLGVVAKWPRFDSTKAKFSTYFAVVVQRTACSLARAKGAQKRGGGRSPISLDRCSADDESLHSLDAASDPSRFDLRDDVRAVVSSLHPDLQPLAHAMMKMSPTVAARSLRIPRRTAKVKIDLIREKLIEAGLEP